MTPRGRALLRAVLLAAFCGLVLGSRVYMEYTPIRLKLVTNATSAEQGALAIDVPYDARLAEQPGPIAVIAELENPGSNSLTLNISWNSTHIGSATLKPKDRARFDLTLPQGVTLRGDDRIRFKGPGSAWRLTYLELANLHGSARGIVNAVILPAATTVTPVRSWPVVLLIAAGLGWIAFLGMTMRWPWRAAAIAHAVAVALVLTLFAAALFSGLVTRYRVLVAWDTFWIGTGILVLRGLVRMVLELRQLLGKRWLGSTAAFDSIVIALIVAGFFTAAMFTRLNTDYHGNYSGFLQLNKGWLERTPVLAGRDDIRKTLLLGDGMYDGTFMYLMAYDPFLSAFKDNPDLYHQVVDTPPYRYTRIGFSLLTRVVALNHPERYPATMMWLIIASHFVACLVLGAILRHYGAHPAWALLYMFIPGFLQSLSAGLPESIAGAALLAGIWCLVRSQYAWAALCLAASLLVRETGILFVAIIVLWLWSARRDWRAGVIVGLAAVPLLAWRAFVAWRLFPVFGWPGLVFMPGTTDVPFKGILEMWRDIHAGTYYPSYPALSVAGHVLPVLLTCALLVSLVLVWKRRDGLSAAGVAYSFLALTHDYPHVWVHVGNAERVTYDVFLLLLVAFATLGREARGRRALLLGFFAFTIIYAVYISFGAELVRAVLFSPTATLF